jgi:hypothetical protein
METENASAPTGLRVQRRFEASRIADDCQARAYEQIIPAAAERASGAPGELAEGEPTRAEQGVAV